MKKMVIVTVLALAMLAAVEHKASAWGILKIGAGFNMTLAGGPSRISIAQPLPYPPFLGMGFCNPYAGYGYPCATPPALTPPPAPLPPHHGPKPFPKPTAQGYNASPWGAEYQPVNYLSPVYSEYFAYWYGR
jgi:hypothetical protein